MEPQADTNLPDIPNDKKAGESTGTEPVVKVSLSDGDKGSSSGSDPGDDDDKIFEVEKCEPASYSEESSEDDFLKGQVSEDEKGGKRRSTRLRGKERRKDSSRSRQFIIIKYESSDDTGEEGGEAVEPSKDTPVPRAKYDVRFKLKVLKYVDKHSSAAAASKFGLTPKRIQEWKRVRGKIEAESMGELYGGCTIEEKLAAVAFAKTNSVAEASVLYKVDKRTIEKWTKDKEGMEEFITKGEGRGKRIKTSGRKPVFPHIEDALRDWVRREYEKGLRFSSSTILDKAKELIRKEAGSRNVVVPSTKNWAYSFVSRHNLKHVIIRKKESDQTKDAKDDPDSNLLQIKVEDKDKMPESPPSRTRGRHSTLKARTSNLKSEETKETKEEVEDEAASSADEEDGPAESDEAMSSDSDSEPPAKKRKKSSKSKKSTDTPIKRGRKKRPPYEIRKGPYDHQFKLEVLQYAETHPPGDTAQKFQIRTKRIREWKQQRSRIEAECNGEHKHRSRTDLYTIDQKLEAVKFAEEHSTFEARVLYNIDRKTLETWKKEREKFEAITEKGQGGRKRREGCGRKPQYTQIEGELRDWIIKLRLRGITLNNSMILSKARKLLTDNTSEQKIKPPSTHTWVQGFLQRHNLYGMLGTTLGREDPSEVLVNHHEKVPHLDITQPPDDIPENPNKRQRRTITLADKINIIERIEKGETQTGIARSLRVAHSTVQTIWSNRQNILKKYMDPENNSKNIHWKKYLDLDSSLYAWYEQLNLQGVEIDGKMLFSRAIELCESSKKSEFTPQAVQWTEMFCKKHAIKGLTIPPKLENDQPLNTHMLQGSFLSNTHHVPGQILQRSQPQQHPTHQIPTHQIPPSSQADHSADSNDHFDDFTPEFEAGFPTVNAEQRVQNHAQYFQQHVSNSSVPVQNGPHHSSSAYSNSNVIHQGGTSSVTVMSTMYAVKSAPDEVKTEVAMHCVEQLRKWISCNFGSNNKALNHHLNAVESAIMKKQIREMSHRS